MLEREINTLSTDDWPKTEETIERICARAGLWASLKTTLKQYPGCVHWHFKQAGVAGVIEITLWPAQKRLWFSVHDNRNADWIPAMLEKIAGDCEYWL